MKKCSKCGELKDEEGFHKNKTINGGLAGWCKNCTHTYRAKYYAQNKEEASEYLSQYRRNNRGKISEYNLKYRQRPNGIAAHARHNHKRRNNIRFSEEPLSLSQWNTILKNQKNKCAECGSRFTTANPPTRDHIIPVSMGGVFEYWNIQALCISCNSKKRARLDYNKIITWGMKI